MKGKTDSRRPSETERREVATDRQGRLRRAIVEAQHKREVRNRLERQEAEIKAEQKKAEAERAKAEKKAEAERPLEEKWAEVEAVRARYDHGDSREFRAVSAERAERRRAWFGSDRG